MANPNHDDATANDLQRVVATLNDDDVLLETYCRWFCLASAQAGRKQRVARHVANNAHQQDHNNQRVNDRLSLTNVLGIEEMQRIDGVVRTYIITTVGGVVPGAPAMGDVEPIENAEETVIENVHDTAPGAGVQPGVVFHDENLFAKRVAVLEQRFFFMFVYVGITIVGSMLLQAYLFREQLR